MEGNLLYPKSTDVNFFFLAVPHGLWDVSSLTRD